MIQNKALQKLAQESAEYVKEMKPVNENQLLKTLRDAGFTGYMIKRGKFARVEAEIFSVSGNVRGKIGSVEFDVPTCKTFFQRDKSGKIINIDYVMEDNLERAKEREALNKEIESLKCQLKEAKEYLRHNSK